MTAMIEVGGEISGFICHFLGPNDLDETLFNESSQEAGTWRLSTVVTTEEGGKVFLQVENTHLAWQVQFDRFSDSRPWVKRGPRRCLGPYHLDDPNKADRRGTGGRAFTRPARGLKKRIARPARVRVRGGEGRRFCWAARPSLGKRSAAPRPGRAATGSGAASLAASRSPLEIGGRCLASSRSLCR